MFKRQISSNSGQTRTFSASVRAAISAATLIGCTYATQAHARTCESIWSLHLPDTLITEALSIPAGSYQPPGSPIAFANLPAFCRVTATVTPVPGSSIGIEVWLPTTIWNGRYLQVGSHGFQGTFFWSEMAPQLQRGFATGSTDGGHTAPANALDVSWANPITEVDFAWRAVHELAVTAKLLTKAYYGKESGAYFNGCSDGGREGLRDRANVPK